MSKFLRRHDNKQAFPTGGKRPSLNDYSAAKAENSARQSSLNYDGTTQQHLDNGNVIDYKIFDETAYHAETPDEVVRILNNARHLGTRLRVWYGDPETGRDWGEDARETTGTVGRSGGRIPIPLLIKSSRSLGGGSILDDRIVKIVRTSDKAVLYQHPTFKQMVYCQYCGLSIDGEHEVRGCSNQNGTKSPLRYDTKTGFKVGLKIRGIY